jgi:pyruvate formate lyase activating enzyme
MIYECKSCKRKIALSDALPYCGECIRTNYESLKEKIERIHSLTRKVFSLPEDIPTGGNAQCNICINSCKPQDNEYGFCGITKGIKGRIKYLTGNKNGARLKWYYDALPTNCVAAWVCAGCSSAGYPKYSYYNKAEYGFKNLAVFYEACNFNCLFCQNWHYRESAINSKTITPLQLANKVDAQTSCICYFGGDPTPQFIHSLATCFEIRKKINRIFRFCWETNGSINQSLLKIAADLAFESGGCIKIDLKAYNNNLHRALTACSNTQTLRNIKFLSSYINERKDPPFLIVSTLLVPGYIDEQEIYNISKFLASINKNIPFSLLGFYPQFYMNDIKPTTLSFAEKCASIARQAGLTNIHIANL